MVGVLAFRLPGPIPLRTGVGLGVAVGALVGLWRLPGWRGPACFAGVFSLVLAGFLALRPSQDRDWWPDVACTPTFQFHGAGLTVHRLRNGSCETGERTQARYETRHYDLRNLQGMDLFLVSWGSPHIAHTILSFNFGAGEYLAFSFETRKERHEAFSSLKGFFREYELCVVAGTEEDLIGIRANHRGEQVRLYRLNTPPDVTRAIFIDYATRANGLALKPEWYNALTQNCTTAMVGPVRRRSGRLPWSWKLVLSGHVDELLYDCGIIDRSLPFAEVRSRALINAQARIAAQSPDFSRRIREGR